MVFGEIVLFGGAMLMPPDSIFVPPLNDPWLKPLVFGGLSLLLLPLGLGFCLRSKVAWWGFFAYLLIRNETVNRRVLKWDVILWFS